ncbi:MAG: TonB-dependent receptor domain-containing protein [Flavobacteriaceae bacterium]
MKTFIQALFLVFTLVSQAQMSEEYLPKKGSISGQVSDSLTTTPLPYVNVVINDLNKAMISGGITNDNGVFQIKNLDFGNYTLSVQYMGYKTFTTPFELTKENFKIDLGVIHLQEDSAQLDEVEIRAETSTVEQKIDRRVINVGKDLTAAGATAAELLNNVQSVTVDSQTGNISLRGNENVRVLVDGKPTNVSPAQILQQIPSSSIKSVELITNPSAKYNPEGMSGIINIVLHKGARIGFNGTLNAGVTQGKNTRYNGSLDLNYKTGIVNFFANYGYNYGNQENHGYVDRPEDDLLQEFDFLNTNRSNLLKAGADLYLNDKNTVSFYATLNDYKGTNQGTTMITENNQLNFNSLFTAEPTNQSETYNLNYALDFDKEGHNIELEGTWSSTDAPEYATYQEELDPNNPNQNYINDVTNDRSNSLINLDYVNPLGENMKLELGLESRINNTQNQNITTQEDPVIEDSRVIYVDRPNSSFRYDREIYSAYVNFNQQLEKFSYQLGARFEQYLVDGNFQQGDDNQDYSDQIFSIYPSAYLNYNPSQKNNYQLSFSRRVDRPGIQQVNPIREWSTPLITSVGNPELDPQFTNSYEFNYTHNFEKGSFTTGLFYRYVTGNISRILNVDPEDNEKIILSYFNTEDNERYGVELSFAYKFANWWRFNASGDLYYQEQSGVSNGENITVSNNAINFRIQNNFTASKNLRFQLFAMYRGGGRDIQFEVDPMWMINAGVNYNVLKGKGSLTFRVNDIFQGMKFKFESTNPYVQNGQFNWESRTAYLGFNYRFGSGKNKAKRRKRRDNNETSGGGFI